MQLHGTKRAASECLAGAGVAAAGLRTRIVTRCVHALSGTEVGRLFKLFRGSKGSSICPQPEAQRELKRLLRVDVAYALGLKTKGGRALRA